MGKTILIIDGGGRGAVLVDAYAKSPKVSKIISIPGNDLMQINTKKPVKIFPDLKTTSVAEIVQISQKHQVDLVDVAQDNAVEAGLVDSLEKIGVKVVGPTREAGQIEWDKAWSREFMLRHKLPVPKFKICFSQKEGSDYIKNAKEAAWFIKANGLLGGKGALPASNNLEALEAIKQMSEFGKEGETFLIEEWLVGEEFSFFALSDGNTYQIIGSAQDHKRMYNFDQGPNTGGMGCSSPPLVVNQPIYHQAEEIVKKTLAGLKKEGRPFKGVLYLGAIVVGKKVYIIEFNARWGSPEAEVLVPSIKNDFYELGIAMTDGSLNKIKLQTDSLSRVSVAIALSTEAKTGKPLQVYGLNAIQKLKSISIYSARIIKKGKKYLAGSGRLVHIVAEGRNIIEARKKAYEAASLIYIEGNNVHFRTDIGWRDVERLTSQKSKNL